MIILRIILLPFTFLYAIGILLRNFFYHIGILSRVQFDIPIVCVGNLAAGGTGKTPHIEWLIENLQHRYELAVLSRGYKRKTTGYLFATDETTTAMIGDEPFQIHQKFPNIALAVSENRVLGIPDLLTDAPETQLILMDDGYQHLPLKADAYILLTDYNNLFTQDWLLPSGLLREFRSAYHRAAFIVVTKCPEFITKEEKEKIIAQIKPDASQQVLFSSIVYGKPQPVIHAITQDINSNTSVVAFSGIANPKPFESFVEEEFAEVITLKYPDHHSYTIKHFDALRTAFNNLTGSHKILLCTEKDAVKIKQHELSSDLSDLPFYYLPIQVKIHQDQGEVLIAYIENLIRSKA